MVRMERAPSTDIGRPVLVYHPDYLNYDFSPDHALREVRVKLAWDLIEALGLRVDADTPTPPMADERDILAVHDARYVRVVKRLSADPRVPEPEFGLGPGDNPPFAGMYEAAALQVGGTRLACDLVAARKAVRAYNLGGGFHHAMAARASGFCIFNDVGVGIAHLLESGFERVLYVDIDGHHGDGVQAMFYRDPRVLTISLHEDGRYLFPGTGFVDEIGEGEGRGFAVNVPLPPHTGDRTWTRAFDAIVLPLADAYRPDILVTQTGTDAHASDPLTHLELTTESYEHAGSGFDAISRRWCDGRWVAVGGGGYDLTSVPRIWTLMFAALSRRRADNALPEEWLEECRNLARAEPRGGALRDEPPMRDETTTLRAVEKTVAAIEDAVFAIHGLR